MSRIGYVLKVYPRFSETFVVTEILAREGHGDDLTIYALRPTTDARFHPEIARVRAEVKWVPRPLKPSELWAQLTSTLVEAGLATRFAEILPLVRDLPGDEVAQGVSLAAQLQADGITHLHAHFASLAGRTAWIASQLTGVPYTVTTHAKDIYHQSVDRTWLRRVCGDADRVIAISQFNADFLAEVLAGTDARITLQYNALELDRFPCRVPQAPGHTLQILSVGRLVPKKGFADLIAAAWQLRAGGVEARVQIAGDGELRGKLQAQIDELGLTEQVQLLGPRTQAEVRELLRQADVFAAPCIPTADGNIDGLPTVVLEAMAAGTPVVAAATSGLPEVVRDGQTGVLVAPGDVAALRDALTGFHDGSYDAKRLAHAARALIEEQFDSRRQAANLSAWQNNVRN